MTLLILYVLTFVLFLGFDYLGLTYIVKPAFEEDAGHLLAEQMQLGAAVAFYAFYVGVLLWFVSWPGLIGEKPLWWVFGNAALFGAAAYGTYEFTNMATLKGWSWRMVATDLTWGIALTGSTATLAVAITRGFR